MSLLVANQIEKSFGGDAILSGVSLRLEWGRKMGLVGRNGCGKTTLLRILTGQMEPDRGTVSYSRGIRFGYLRQEQMVEHGWSVYDEAQDAFAPVLEMELRLRRLQHAMADARGEGQLQSVMDEYGLLHDRFEAMGGYESLRDIKLVLKRLGFSETDLDKPTARLSGGEKTRLAVARLLLSAPDVLLLDEPTNHLDLEATEWLEGFLHDFGGAVILVSHDRYFLDRVVTSVAELDRTKLTIYPGSFSAYWTQRDANRKRQQELFERDQRDVARLLEFFEKWKNTPSKRTQAVMRKRWAERIREKMVERPTASGKSMKAGVKAAMRSGNEVVIIDQLTKSFGERTLFEDVDLFISRGQHVGIVGPNGAGKSTLIRMLIGEENPTSGSVRIGANVTVGYFAQEASGLDLEATVLENMFAVGEMQPVEARTHLGRFLFTGDDVFRPVSTLSGGEKNKLALAQLTWLKPNLLILDEPTNHLDIDSREALVETLRRYDGTLILISHDRYLLDQITGTTIEIADGRVTVFEGPYREYKEAKGKARLAADGGRQVAGGRGQAAGGRRQQLSKGHLRKARNGPLPQTDDSIQVAARTGHIQNPLTAGMNSHQLSKERRRAIKQVAETEGKVADLEDWLKRIEEALSAPMPGDDVAKMARDHEQAQSEVAAALEEWEKAHQYAEAIGAAV